MVKKFLACFLLCCLICTVLAESSSDNIAVHGRTAQKDYIKWLDFNASYNALEDAMNTDIETFNQDLHISWIDILAYLATKYGGSFSAYKSSDISEFVAELQSGKSVKDITSRMKYYSYYHEAYNAVLGNYLGMDKNGNYGLTAYSPLAAGYWYNDCDDFGNGRSYGFARKHLGHDMFCSVGSPVVAVEGGRIEALGWNQYGGWRIGIRSNDKLRYYYYAHLRKDSPYIKGLKEGDYVKAGQIIGFTGQSGYSIKENINNINVPHLHFGLQLVFDESQKECNSEIWIDVYAITRLLSKHRSQYSSEASVPTSQSADVPILMYHGLTEKSSKVNTYFIPVQTFESDMKYLKDNGYTAINMTDLIKYVNDSSSEVCLPKKPVVITFDDGYCNNYNLATPILKKYSMKAVISVIGHACEEASQATYRAEAYCNVTWNQIRKMSASGLWEIQNHTYNLHEIKGGRKGACRKMCESDEVYEEILSEDLSKLQKKLKSVTGYSPNTFTWPFGAFNREPVKLLESLGFNATLSCTEGINTIKKGDPSSLFLLKRNLRSPDVSISSLL